MKGLSRHRLVPLVGVMLPELGTGYHAQMMSGVGDQLIEMGCSYLTAQHRHRKELIEQYSRLLISRGADAVIAMDTALQHALPVPVVAVAGPRPMSGITRVVLDHRLAAEQALMHLHSLGHRRIVFMCGHPFNSDCDDRWRSITKVAEEMNIPINPKLVVRYKRDICSPEFGYRAMQDILAARTLFTAVVAFDDMSAIGAMRALQDFGLRVPADVSVIGFDDVDAAAFSNPKLTTIRQPLAQMGRIVAQCVLKRLHKVADFQEQITIEPVLIVRESTNLVRPLERSQAHRLRRRIRNASGTIFGSGRG